METEVVTVEEDNLKQLAISDLARAKALVVIDSDSYRDCCMFEIQIKEGIKEAERKLEPVVDSTRKAWKAALKLLADIVTPRNEALAYVQSLRVNYEEIQKEKAKQKQAIETTAALENTKRESEQVAIILEQSGEAELAEQVRSNVVAPIVNVEPDIPVIKGIATDEKWFFRIVDESKIARTYMAPDEKKIQGLVNSQHKDAAPIVGGIEVWSENKPRGAAKK
jgi:hypothetical protein